MDSWNGISLLWDIGLQAPNVKVQSDASGSWGCGAYCNRGWFQLRWPSRFAHLSIVVKEMIPVVIAAALFGQHWGGKIVEFVVDNAAVVLVLKATYSQDFHLMYLVRVLVFFASKLGFWFVASHIPGVKNVAADALSRNNLSAFFSQVP